ncbi:type II secretion system protein XpsI [Pseudoxanthomonas sacheonensis]|uniref:type II secretion system protein XpsI n=1 Tax=Pseudoxanthomonas sacheonensis TaxID=443615 RepID=UPI0013D61ED0|nr:prepilin-type N-terminal cleavage/methylation domain-containing protein [Pseudoxanthomonas sacheonensis]KAF1706091.1 general secretion pathway protein GspI [Pseudoxanthomonas sacheonensis]
MRSHRYVRVGAIRRGQRGFTLIEVIIAFALLALALTLLLGSLSGAARQIRTADDNGRATLHAQSLLAQVGVGEVLQPGRKQGTFEEGRYRWALEVEPYVDPLKQRSPQAGAGAGAPRLLQLQLDVEWGDAAGQRLRWRTLRLAPADVNAPALVP